MSSPSATAPADTAPSAPATHASHPSRLEKSLPALTLAGRNDVAYRLFLTDTYPSWLFQVKLGSTTMWERVGLATTSFPWRRAH